MGDATELPNAIRNAFEGIRRDYTYPTPKFHGTKHEKPEDYWLKVKDWLAHFQVAEDDKIDRFKETPFGQPRAWFHFFTCPGYFDGGHPATLKKIFLTRWSMKGKTADALMPNGKIYVLILLKMI